MHPSLFPVVFGEHAELASKRGIPHALFVELQTADRHALICSLVNRRGSTKVLGSASELQSYIRGIDQLIVSAAKKIECAELWSAKAYRDLGKLTQCAQALKFLRHVEKITEQTIAILQSLPTDWRRPSIVRLVNSADQARALVSLGQTIGILFGDKRQEEFRELVERLTSVEQIQGKFYSFVFRSMDASCMPASATPYFERITSYSDCRRLAQLGHCFGDLDMVECVFEAQSYFYVWSRRRDVVVEIEKDDFPFSWTVVQACKPKNRPLTSRETTSLMADIQGLGVPITTNKLSPLVSASLEQFD